MKKSWTAFCLVALLLGNASAAIESLDKLADDWDFDCPHQIGHEHETVFHYADHVNGLTPEITGDLPRHFLYSFLDLLCG